MKKIAKANEFIEKARDQLDWSESSLADMREHGKHARIASIRRLFFSVLVNIGSANDAIGAAARAANLNEWDSELSQQRKNDPLLNYFWAARNVDMHAPLIKWEPIMSELSIKIIDAQKAQRAGDRYPLVSHHGMRLWCFLYNVSTTEQVNRKIVAGRWPTNDRMESAGVEFVEMLHTLKLVPFVSTAHGQAKKYEAPVEHMGQTLKPLVEEAVTTIIIYYRTKLAELSKLIQAQPPIFAMSSA